MLSSVDCFAPLLSVLSVFFGDHVIPFLELESITWNVQRLQAVEVPRAGREEGAGG